MRRDIPHHTQEEVVQYLFDALAAVDAVHMPDDLRPVAFGHAIALIAAKTVAIEQVAPSGILANVERNRR